MFTIRPTKNDNGNGHKNGGNGHKNGGNGHKNGGNGQAGPIESVIGPGIHYTGQITGAGGIRIEGTFDGSISIGGALVIAEGAKVTADIHAGAVLVGGTVKGNIAAAKVEILATGRVYGDLTTAAFASEDGAFLRGKVVMQDELPQAQPRQPAPQPA